MDTEQNAFISYINSLHNVAASGANALAESQALSPYFGEIYQPFPLVDSVVDALTDGAERVLVLTGHAGDGKSSVALDVLKRLRKLSLTAPLQQPLKEREDITCAGGLVSIAKDMSELSAARRQQWLREAFSEPGSWLIVSNTGPLLNSLVAYAKEAESRDDIESELLKCLDQPFAGGQLTEHRLGGFRKELIIVNMTRIDNLALGAGILARLVNHSAWGQCAGCCAEPACPLVLNRKALQAAATIVEERVRWIYQRLVAYEQRLTLRQMVAHLAFGLTGGMSCEEAKAQVMSSSAEGVDKGTAGLERIVYSEGFFGYSRGTPSPAAEALRAISLVRRATFGGPVGVNFERRLPTEEGIGWAILPPSLAGLDRLWRQRAAEPAGVRWRFALRRLAYLFGDPAPVETEEAETFLDAFLQSPSLRYFDRWQVTGKLTLTRSESNRLRTACLRVLLEIFSGFSAGQFQSTQDRLYLTLRRPDRAVVQPTQLVMAKPLFDEFDLDYDEKRRLLRLRFRGGQVRLELTLPLLDYIRARDAGELGNELSPIHLAQLEWFRAELLRATRNTRPDDDEIELLRAGIDGRVYLHRYLMDKANGTLEVEL